MMKYHQDMTRSERQENALDRILELVVLLDRDMTQSLEARGLTTARAHLLWELGRSGPATQSSLAGALGVSARNITGLVDGLVATGFVTRQSHPTDRRAAMVTFTERGAATAQILRDEQQDLARMLFAGMPDERFDCFADGLDQVVGVLRSAVTPEPAGGRSDDRR
jgi:DNA-binding MarR family transcriptional regulator